MQLFRALGVDCDGRGTPESDVGNPRSTLHLCIVQRIQRPKLLAVEVKGGDRQQKHSRGVSDDPILQSVVFQLGVANRLAITTFSAGRQCGGGMERRGLRTHSLRLAMLLRCARWTNAVRLDPIILYSRGQGFNLREEACHLPHFLLT
jgi:hypothetical protein